MFLMPPKDLLVVRRPIIKPGGLNVDSLPTYGKEIALERIVDA